MLWGHVVSYLQVKVGGALKLDLWGEAVFKLWGKNTFACLAQLEVFSTYEMKVETACLQNFVVTFCIFKH
jgi:hypothetical protein